MNSVPCPSRPLVGFWFEHLLTNILWLVTWCGALAAQQPRNPSELHRLLTSDATVTEGLDAFERFEFRRPSDAYAIAVTIVHQLTSEHPTRADRALAALVQRAPLLAGEGLYDRVIRLLASRATAAGTAASTRARVALRAIERARPEDPVDAIRRSLESADRRTQNIGVGQAQSWIQQNKLSPDQASRTAILLFDLLAAHPDHSQAWVPLNQIKNPSDAARKALQQWLETRQPDHRTRYPIERGFLLWGKWTNYDPAIWPTALRLLDDRNTMYSATATGAAIASRHPEVLPKFRAAYEASEPEVRDRFLYGLRQPGTNIDGVLDLVIDDFNSNRLAHAAAQTLRHHIQHKPEIAAQVQPVLENALTGPFVLRATSIFTVLEVFPTIPEDLLPKITARVRRAKGTAGNYLAEQAFRFLRTHVPRHPETLQLALEMVNAQSALVRFPAVCALASSPITADLTREQIVDALRRAAQSPTVEPKDLPASADRRSDLARAVALFTDLLNDRECKDIARWRSALTDKERVIAEGAAGLLQRADRVPPALLDSVLTGISGPASAFRQARLIVHAESSAHLDRLPFYYRPLTPRMRAQLDAEFASTSIPFQIAYCELLANRPPDLWPAMQVFQAAGAPRLEIYLRLQDWTQHEKEQVAKAARTALAVIPANRHRPAVLRTRTLAGRLAEIRRSADPGPGWLALLGDREVELRIAALEAVERLLKKKELDSGQPGLVAGLFTDPGEPRPGDPLAADAADTEFALRRSTLQALCSIESSQRKLLGEQLRGAQLRTTQLRHRVRLGLLRHGSGLADATQPPRSLLRAGFRDSLPAVRALTLAVSEQTRRTDPDALAELLRLTSDPESSIRRGALYSLRNGLARIRDPEERQRAFRRAFDQLDPNWRPGDPAALVQSLDASATPLVAKYLLEAGPEEARKTLQRIRQWGLPARPLWRNVLMHAAPGRPDRLVAEAWQALLSIGAPHDEESARAILAAIPNLETVFSGRFSPAALESALLLVGRAQSMLALPAVERLAQLDRIADRAASLRTSRGSPLTPTVLVTRLRCGRRPANWQTELRRWLSLAARTPLPTLLALLDYAAQDGKVVNHTQILACLANRARFSQGDALRLVLRRATATIESLAKEPGSNTGLQPERLGDAAKSLVSICLRLPAESEHEPMLAAALRAAEQLPGADLQSAGDLILKRQARGPALLFALRHHSESALRPIPDWLLAGGRPLGIPSTPERFATPRALQQELIRVAIDDPNERRRAGALGLLVRSSTTAAVALAKRWPADRSIELVREILNVGAAAKDFVPWLVRQLDANRKLLDAREFEGLDRQTGQRNLTKEQMAVIGRFRTLTHQRSILLSALAVAGPSGVSQLTAAAASGSEQAIADLDTAVSAALRTSRDAHGSRVITALLSLGDPAPVAHLLVRALTYRDPTIQDAVVTALAASSELSLDRFRQREPLREVERGLRSALGASPTTARLAVETLDRFVPDFDSATYTALSELSLALDPAVRLAVVRAVERRGSSARSMLPTLQSLAKDPDDRVRTAVAEAITAIR